jgi:1-acyl-sn-glycerol-3-phosphate acyltransferase
MDYSYKTVMLIFRIFHLVSAQDCKVYGELNFPLGAKIIAGNHPNATDGFFLPFIFKEQLYFFIQGDLFDIPIIGWLFTKCGQIKVDPEQKKLAMEQGLKYLEQDKPVAIFPEARLNPNGQAMKSNTGAIRLSLATKAPIIPIGFYVPPINLHHISRMKKGQVSQGHWQRKGHCYLHFGSPWLPCEESGVSMEKSDVYRLTELLMQKINELSQLAAMEYEKETGLSADLATFNKR